MATQRRVSPRFQSLQRRVSPRFQNLQNGRNSNIRKTRNASESRKTSNTRVSPRFQNLPSGGNSNIGKIWNASESRKTSTTRVNPRLRNLPNVGNLNFEKIWNSTDSGKTSNTRVSPNSKIEKMCNATNSTETSNTGGSLSFQNLPDVEIWDATDSRKTSNTRVSPRFQSLLNCGNSNTEKIQNVLDSRKISDMIVSPRLQSIPLEKRPYYGSFRKRKTLIDSPDNSNIEKIGNALDSRKTSSTRVSPRFQSIPLEKRPYYGSCQKRKTLNDSHGKSNIEKIQNVLDSGKTSNTRVSPRFQSIPLEKRPYYGSCQKRKTLNDSHGKSTIEKIQNVLDSRKTSNTRVSPRFQSIPLEKRPYYGSSQKRKTLDASQDTLMVKKHKAGNAEVECVSNGSVTVENGEKDAAHLQETGTKGGNSGDDITSIHGTGAAMVVKDKLRLFNKYFLHFSKKEDACEGNVKQSKCQGHFKLSKCKGRAKQSKTRPDLMAISEMLKKNEVLCHKRYFGDLPGIEVGHCFYFRAEMVAVGLHKLLLKGIDYIGSPYVKSEYSGYTFPLAGAIVLSGQYEDDFDNSEEIVYTGEGGNDLFGGKHQDKDQVMLRGNLALKNNKEQSVPVRVIRGHKCDDSYSKTLYIYDGLYKVTDYWDEKGISGFKVFKYRLKRLQGQDNLTSRNQVHFVRGKVSRVNEELPGLICKDISNGQEDKCIPVFNLYSPTVAPTGFKYIKSIQVAKNVSIPPDAPGCKCRGKCTNPKSCSCAKLNGGDFPYVSRDGGRLFEAKDVVFECGPNCGCGPECANRASQKGLKYHLEVYRTKDKGWAVRSLDFIPSGAPVCEYVGILRKNYELEDISENDYIFEIDCWHTMKGIGGRERRLGDVSLPMPNLVNEDEETLESEPEPEFCIDASSFGNVARFINHSCDPNLFVQCVLSSHHDVRLARIVLFAADNIPRMQELTYDYNYAIDSVVGPDGKTKQLPCFCGTDGCRKRLY
ncbi:hypothetical protein HRI_001155200 [Hibiscus trionum]|uniref:Histone-lysine N-methyltransferase, H3 lysine-9 specific SUVH4-like n=1 Tax=Hibiscus trionum TaxID=183268 RepID=A0A9W7HCB1_HIBTR|nr:hypothetical protein HRI_001155200 [Hibiscus trionum]